MKVNKLFVIFTIIIAFLFFIEGEVIFNLAFYCVILCWIISLISLIISYFGISIEIEFSQRKYNTVDNYDFNLKLKNKLYSFIPFAVVNYISGNKLVTKMLYMNLHKEEKIKSEIMFQYRGIYDFNDFKLEIKDIMFIFTKYKYLKNKPKIRVYPKVWSIKQDEINKLNYIFKTVIGKNLIENDYLNVKDIRKYKYNDSYKRIHWKATSKTGQLYVKNYENFDNGKIKVFIDMNEYIMKLGKGVEEKYIEYSVSMLSYIMDKHSKFEIHFINDNEKTIFSNGKSEFGQVMEYLIYNKCTGKKNVIDSILNPKNAAEKDCMCIIVFKIDESLREKIVLLEKSRIKYIVFYFEDKYLSTIKIQCFSMSKMMGNG